MEITRVKKAKLIVEATARRPNAKAPATTAEELEAGSSCQYPQALERPPPKRRRLHGKQPESASGLEVPDVPLAPLAYAQAVEVQPVANEELQQFLLQEFGLPEGSHWKATCIETGGGGDCFFHAVGSILERMLLAP